MRNRLRLAARKIAANRNEPPASPLAALRKIFIQERRDWSRPGAPRIGGNIGSRRGAGREPETTTEERMFCTECNEQVVIHADGTAMCGDHTVYFEDMKTLPESWEDKAEISRKMKEARDYTDF